MAPQILFISALCVVVSLLVFVNQAHAYIDPGTGSMIIQAVLAVVATAAVSICMFWARVKLFLARLFGRKKDE